ncbi:DUF4097 family beta strand repeat-containing protein [Clostridium ganghwense]|uniref:DUF4097 family beta strand repeat-containing protein n=1 Tax=Clostridium ganghwense TaxID=312089 RepID=A0ABT4CLJ6_9CLOT|nr:DUF4097 family beta strand repeat-containing protein [Clostridium ganghwense]MCY6369908.1 DUF4097 family beta strand repeat-containing protein [Clostridium ganghwense]
MRKWRVGTISMGIMLIGTGIILLLSQITGINGAEKIIKWWPIILIILGLETLAYIYFSKEENPKVKMDVLSIISIIFILLVCSGIYAVNNLMNGELSDVFLSEIGHCKYSSVFNKKYKINASNVKNINIDVFGDLKVEKYEGNNIEIESIITMDNNDEKYAKEISDKIIEIDEGETLRISSKKEQYLRSNRRIRNVRISYYIKVPKKLNYDINNKSGMVELKELIGDIEIDSNNSDIEIKKVSGNISIDNKFGKIDIKDVKGLVSIENSKGNISYESKEINNSNIEIENEAGDVNIKLPEKQQGAYKFNTKYGNIDVDGFKLKINKEENDKQTNEKNREQNVDEIVGKDSPIIRVEVNNGDIRLRGR